MEQARIDKLIGFMAIMQVPFMHDPDALGYIMEVKEALKELAAMKTPRLLTLEEIRALPLGAVIWLEYKAVDEDGVLRGRGAMRRREPNGNRYHHAGSGRMRRHGALLVGPAHGRTAEGGGVGMKYACLAAQRPSTLSALPPAGRIALMRGCAPQRAERGSAG